MKYKMSWPCRETNIVSVMMVDTIQIEMLGFPTTTEVENETTCGNGISPFPVHFFILQVILSEAALFPACEFGPSCSHMFSSSWLRRASLWRHSFRNSVQLVLDPYTQVRFTTTTSGQHSRPPQRHNHPGSYYRHLLPSQFSWITSC